MIPRLSFIRSGDLRTFVTDLDTNEPIPPMNPVQPTPPVAPTLRHTQRLRRCGTPSHSHDRYGSGAGNPPTCRPLLGFEAVPQEGGDPPEHLGELLTLLGGEGPSHTLLDAAGDLVGAQYQGLALGRE